MKKIIPKLNRRPPALRTQPGGVKGFSGSLRSSFKRVVLNPLTYILILAFVIRSWNVDTNPAGFFTDEASIGYNAYSILRTGRDEWKRPFPVFFKAFGEYKNPVYIYSSIPFIALFGPTEKGVRMASVFYGTLTVLFVYLLAKELFNRRVGYLSGFMLAVSPWHIHLSRIGFELISSLFWVTAAFYFLHRWIKGKTDLFYGLVSLVLAYFSYYTPKIYLPFLVLLFIFLHKEWIIGKALTKATLLRLLVILFLFFLFIGPAFKDGTFFARWQEVRVKDLSLSVFARGYLNHFSPDFLFNNGDSGFPGQFLKRHSIIGIGQLFWFQLPLIFFGLLAFFRHRAWRKSLAFVTSIVLLYPTGSIFTGVIPQATRSAIGVIPFQILSGVGLYVLFTLFKKRLVRTGLYLLVFLLISLSFWRFIGFLNRYPLYSSGYWGWQYGFREIMRVVKNEENNYDQLLITHRFNRGEELLKFYNLSFICGKCKIMSNPISIDLAKRQLFALRVEDIEEAGNLYPSLRFERKNTIRLPNGQEEIFIGIFVF